MSTPVGKGPFMEKQQLTIAVSGLNNTDNPGPGIPVIRGLKEAGSFNVRIIGLAYENMEPGIYMRDMIDKCYQLPYPSCGVEALLKRLNYIQDIEGIDVLIPNFDAELFTFIKLADTLRSMGIRTFLPTMRQFEERHKDRLPGYGKRYGVKIPESRPVMSVREMLDACDKFGYPSVVKGKYYDASVVATPDQATRQFARISGKWGLPIIVQEFVRGTEVNVIALGDGRGVTVAAVPMRKQYITDKGKAWSGITLDDKEMMAITRDLIAKTRWRGGMELEMIKTEQGEYYIIEINPRIPAWVYLAVGAGQNIPELLVRCALGQDVKPSSTFKVGTMFIRYSLDLICDIKEFEQVAVTGEY